MNFDWTYQGILVRIALGVVCFGSGCSQTTNNNSVPSVNASSNSTKTLPTTPVPAAKTESEVRILLTDFSTESGLDFKHQYDGLGEKYILEALASGIATIDYDADGLMDVYFLNGASIGTKMTELLPNALYRNLGGFKFARVTEASGTDDRNFSTGVAVADYDNDGFSDIFVNNYGPDRLYRNNGDGTFSDLTDTAKVSRMELGAGACFFDADGDGLLDLYASNYVKSPVEKNVKRTTDGNTIYPGPLDFEPENDFFFHNEGDGTFTDVSRESGISEIRTTSMGTVATDYDNDGDIDMVIVNDLDRNLLLDNDGTGKFTEVGIQRGIAFSFDGRRNGKT